MAQFGIQTDDTSLVLRLNFDAFQSVPRLELHWIDIEAESFGAIVTVEDEFCMFQAWDCFLAYHLHEFIQKLRVLVATDLGDATLSSGSERLRMRFRANSAGAVGVKIESEDIRSTVLRFRSREYKAPTPDLYNVIRSLSAFLHDMNFTIRSPWHEKK